MSNLNDRAARYLGFAFASADLLFELDPNGKIIFALGARSHVVGGGEAELVGAHWTRLVSDRDHELMRAMLDQLRTPGRCGPVRLALRAREGAMPRHAAFSACRLDAANSNIFCVLSLNAASNLTGASQSTELLGRDDFINATPQIVSRAFESGVDLILELIDVDSIRRTIGTPEQAEAVIDSLSTLLRAESYGGGTAAQLSPEQFALLRPVQGGANGFAERLNRFSIQHGLDRPPASAAIPLDGRQPPIHMLRALRFTLDAVLTQGLQMDADDPGSPAALFAATMEQTLCDAERFQAKVANGDFKLVYQPVVDLRSGLPRHFEALARFDDNESPSDAIRMAEELGIIERFDLAVANIVSHQILKSKERLALAFNISARSLLQDSFTNALCQMIEKIGKGPAKRLTIEITESFRIYDLKLANENIQKLRARGVMVCMDDFGAGEATLRYLRELEVDVVKIDGLYVRGAVNSPRDQILLRHITSLCADLKVLTVAEMIETTETAELVRNLGVDMGQGWLFGGPSEQPVMRAQDLGTSTARRAGARETWG